jgi:hypothetical protein
MVQHLCKYRVKVFSIENEGKDIGFMDIITDTLVENFNKNDSTESRIETYRSIEYGFKGDIYIKGLEEQSQEKNKYFRGEIWINSKNEDLSLAQSLKSFKKLDDVKPETSSKFKLIKNYFLLDLSRKIILIASNARNNIRPQFAQKAFLNKAINLRLHLLPYPDKFALEKLSKGKIIIKDLEFRVGHKESICYRYKNNKIKGKNFHVKIEEVKEQNEGIEFIKNILKIDNKETETQESVDEVRIWDIHNRIIDMINGYIEYLFDFEFDEDNIKDPLEKSIYKGLISKYYNFISEYSL